MHNEYIMHLLKEVDASAMAWATTAEQVVKSLKHIIS